MQLSSAQHGEQNMPPRENENIAPTKPIPQLEVSMKGTYSVFLYKVIRKLTYWKKSSTEKSRPSSSQSRSDTFSSYSVPSPRASIL